MKRIERPWGPLCLVTALLCSQLVGCARHQENAVAALGKVDAACAKQDQDGARQILREEAEKNAVFREAYEKSKESWKVTEDAKVNPCGIFLADLKKRLGRGD